MPSGLARPPICRYTVRSSVMSWWDEEVLVFSIALVAEYLRTCSCFDRTVSGAWAASSASARDKPISGLTVTDLGRDGMLALSEVDGTASARLTKRGSWFARTAVTEMAERSGP